MADIAIRVADREYVQRARRRGRIRYGLGRVALYMLAIVAALAAAAPFMWGTITSGKYDAVLYNSGNNPIVFNLQATGPH
jgi:multiple sugar transport system permease protein